MSSCAISLKKISTVDILPDARLKRFLSEFNSAKTIKLFALDFYDVVDGVERRTRFFAEEYAGADNARDLVDLLKSLVLSCRSFSPGHLTTSNIFASYIPELPLFSFCQITFIYGFTIHWTKPFLDQRVTSKN